MRCHLCVSSMNSEQSNILAYSEDGISDINEGDRPHHHLRIAIDLC